MLMKGHEQMVHVHPRIREDPESPYGGLLVIDVPSDNGKKTFSVPLKPTPDILKTWEQ